MVTLKKLKTKRLIIREFKLSDLDDYIVYESDPTIYYYQPNTSFQTREDFESDLKELIERYHTPKYMKAWAIELKEEKKVIGAIYISRLSPGNKFCELGWSLHQNYRGKGYAFEATSNFIDYLFSSTDLHRISINIWKGNIESENLAKKLGFVYEGCQRECRLKDGQFFDSLLFGLLREDFTKMKQ